MALTLQNTIADSYAPYKPSIGALRAYASSSSSKQASASSSDIVQILPTDVQSTGTRTLSDTLENLDNGGYRRTRVFEQEDGRRFSRLEEVSFSQNTARKTVVQQNPSGSITQYEEVLDKQSNGAYRRTQRFTNEAGETSTQITADYSSQDPFILTGGQTAFSGSTNAFQTFRGTQLDLSA